ncbi:two-component sensor histidine kinase [Streptomyces lavendulae subsp. lavendulae]|uniref:sensor histidine kinase n=1 Tax=Streptomyces lavendulae TaxID=1914 RepID=UPI0024A50028|nr:HAMP domain-containing sensor histidine kinase [Streptomyces lavendulae]GLV87320.1 two-component sensor histidine kinase [Streptomyces lavendulae subsp. lavendulae]
MTAPAPAGRRPLTLRSRLSLIAVSITALLMAVLIVAFNGIVRHQLDQRADDHLHTRTAAVASTVDTTGRKARIVEVPNDDALDSDVWIYAGTERLEAPPGAAQDGPLARAADTLAVGRRAHCVTTADPDPVRLCALPLTGNAPATVVAAVGLVPYRTSADTVLHATLALGATVLVLTYVLTRLAVGRALRPVRAMTEQAAAWSAQGGDDRFGTTTRPAELAALATSLDALLDKIRAGLRHEQQLTRELSHELRNPLARIVAELDWWRTRTRSPEETQTSFALIEDAASSMRTICDTLLDDAQGAAAAHRGPADVHATLVRVADRSVPPTAVDLWIAPSAGGPMAAAPAAIVERTVSPLVDNALRYARSRVTVVARSDGTGVRIEVTDDGPGVPASFVHELFRPGQRADAGDGHSGAGLGLSLARRLARSADGDVHHDASFRDGARFVVVLPAA